MPATFALETNIVREIALARGEELAACCGSIELKRAALKKTRPTEILVLPVSKIPQPWNRFLHFCHSRDGQRSFLGFGERKRERARLLLPLLRPSTSATTNTLVTHSLFTLHFVIVIALLAAASLYLFTLAVLSLLIAVALLYVKLRHFITQGRLVFKTNKLWTFKLVI